MLPSGNAYQKWTTNIELTLQNTSNIASTPSGDLRSEKKTTTTSLNLLSSITIYNGIRCAKICPASKFFRFWNNFIFASDFLRVLVSSCNQCSLLFSATCGSASCAGCSTSSETLRGVTRAVALVGGRFPDRSARRRSAYRRGFGRVLHGVRLVYRWKGLLGGSTNRCLL